MKIGNKSLLLFFILLFYVTISHAQNESDLTGLLYKHADKIGVNMLMLAQSKISNDYFTVDGIRMVYLQQYLLNYPVFNSIKVLAFRADSLLSATGEFFKSEKPVRLSLNKKITTPEEALYKVLNYLHLDSNKKIIKKFESKNKFLFDGGIYSSTDMIAELYWLQKNDSILQLVWQIDLSPLHTADHFQIRVDAYNNSIIDKNNFTVYESDLKNTMILNKSKNIENKENSQSFKQLKIQTTDTILYRVIPFPYESPSHLFDSLNIPLNDATLGSVNHDISTWHFDGRYQHDSTKGNNVWSQEDRDNNNSTFGISAFPNLNHSIKMFDANPNFSQHPTINNNQQFAITNLFYWNNIMHDLTYLYGFDEVSGNFQVNNFGKGGLSNDCLIADAQDAGGLNNANFTTPIDGASPRMQMYLFANANGIRDADLDNGIIVHEYTHGLTNRLTGGPGNSSCLINAEQPGEGWSDYFALMMTTNWSLATRSDGEKPRTIGTYAMGQSIDGNGVRTFPYSTNMQINPWTYEMMSTLAGNPHKNGEIWCAILWDLTWNLIELEGINKNIFNPRGNGGNSVALKLIIEAMRLQPCRPGFVDARNAILKADSIWFNKKYSCVIWKTFARRGLGKNAAQGSVNSSKDQVADFNDNIGGDYQLIQHVNEQYESGCISYTNIITASLCYDLNHFTIRDTIPSNVKYIQGGSYDCINRVVSFDVNIIAGATQSYSFSVQVLNSTYFRDSAIINDSVTDNSMNNYWFSYSSAGNDWLISNEKMNSPMFSFKCINGSYVSDNILQSNYPLNIPLNTKVILSFQSLMASESNWDGGVVEISYNNGITWIDGSPFFIQNGYNGKLNQSANPLAGRKAFTGSQVNFQKVLMDLSVFSGKSIIIRFRFGSDENYSNLGWFIDDVSVLISPVAVIKSGLFRQNNQCYAVADVICKIIGTNPFDVVPDSPCLINRYSNCGPNQMNLSVYADSLEKVYWYNDVSESNLLAVSRIFLTPLLSQTTTYWVSKKNIQTACYTMFHQPVIAQVNKIPLPPVTHDTSVCGVQSILISVFVDSGIKVRWYDSISSFRVIDTGIYLHTSNLVSNKNYYVESISPEGCTSEHKSVVHIKMNETPPEINDTRGALKCSKDSAILYASPSNNTRVQWYVDSLGSSPTKIDLVNRVSKFVTPSLQVSTTYWVANGDSLSGCISRVKKAVAAIVYQSPLIPDIQSIEHCGPGVFKFVITSRLLNNERYIWYNVTGSSNSISAATNYTTPFLHATTSYYVVRKNLLNGCISDKKIIQAIVHPLPRVPITKGDTTCGKGQVVLRAESTGYSLNWYTASKGGRCVLINKNSMQIPILDATKSFYVSSRDIVTSCVSTIRAKVTATYIPTLSAPNSINIPSDFLFNVNSGLPVTISCNNVSGAQTYLWNLPVGAFIDSGIYTRKIKARFSAIQSDDTIRVCGYNGCTGKTKTIICYHDSSHYYKKSFFNFVPNKVDDCGVIIFPNPTGSFFKIRIENNRVGPFEIRMFDLLGNQIVRERSTGVTEKVFGNTWRPGIYFIEIHQSGKIIRKKLVKL